MIQINLYRLRQWNYNQSKNHGRTKYWDWEIISEIHNEFIDGFLVMLTYKTGRKFSLKFTFTKKEKLLYILSRFDNFSLETIEEIYRTQTIQI